MKTFSELTKNFSNIDLAELRSMLILTDATSWVKSAIEEDSESGSTLCCEILKHSMLECLNQELQKRQEIS